MPADAVELVAHVEGLAAAMAQLDDLGERVRQNVLRTALRKGANVVKRDGEARLAAAGARRAKGALLVKVSGKQGKESAKVGLVADKGKDVWQYKYLETGAGPHVIAPTRAGLELAPNIFVRGKVNHPGMAARPFLRPALDENHREILDAFGEATRDAIAKQAAKAARPKA